MRNQHQPVVSEGYPFIALFAFITLILALLGWSFLTFVFLLLTLFTVYFFRNPERYPSPDSDIVVAPADGKVIFVGKVPEDRLLDGEEMTKVSIFMNVFNVHVNRVPVSGKVLNLFYNKGQFMNASLDKASSENEQAGLLIETAGGKKFLCVQIAGLVARRIVTYPQIGDELEIGRRFGLIRFGSRVDLYFPEGTEVVARVGDRTVAGETVLGYLR